MTPLSTKIFGLLPKLLVMTLWLFSPIFADSPSSALIDTAQTFSVRIGTLASLRQVRDDRLVPLNFTGPEIGVALGWGYDGPINHLSFGGTATLCYLFDRFGNQGAGYTYDIDLRWLRRYREIYGGELRLGADLDWSIFNRIIFHWDEEHYYWATAATLAPAVGFEKPIREGVTAGITIMVPVVAATARPPDHWMNKIDTLNDFGYQFSRSNRNMRVVTLDRFQRISLVGGVHFKRQNGILDLLLSGMFEHNSLTEEYETLLFTFAVRRSFGVWHPATVRREP